MKINKEYKEIIKDIVNDENFLSLKNDVHHGTNRYDHCKRVAYLSFLFAKMVKGNTVEACTSGLLHDFFYGDSKSEENNYLAHPTKSIENAKKYFSINENEENIIKTHMYHYAVVKNFLPFINKNAKVKAKNFRPESKEGYIVCLADLFVSIFECGIFKVRYSFYLYLIFLINIVRY